MGRPTAFTEDSLAEIAEMLKDGIPIGEACQRVGIQRSCYYRLLRNAKHRAAAKKLAQSRAHGQRRSRILSAVRLGFCTAADIIDYTGMSSWTVRQTLHWLEAEGKLETRSGLAKQPTLYFEAKKG